MKSFHKPGNNLIGYLRKIFGVLLIIGGVIGLFLPILQGVAMILAGIALLGGKPAVRRCRRLAMRVLHLWRRFRR